MPPTPKVRSSEERALGILTGILDWFLVVIDWYEEEERMFSVVSSCQVAVKKVKLSSGERVVLLV